jgi:hypothetical protein
MKTAGRENPNRWGTVPRNRAPDAAGQNTSRSIKWAEKQEKFQPKEMCFFLTSTFIELIRHNAVTLQWVRIRLPFPIATRNGLAARRTKEEALRQMRFISLAFTLSIPLYFYVGDVLRRIS